jgi:2-desacetyl-2-hydroxyethyl bacteriochlorophyllide A dehydrogenase
MKTVICVEPGKLESREAEKPAPAANEVLVKIKSIGICGTDIHAYSGNQPFFAYPRVLGHELSGVVEDVGFGVEVPIGSSVYIIPYISCGECGACKKGKGNCCTNIEVLGVHRDGGMVEYITVPKSAVVVTDGLSFNNMAIIECLAIGAHAVKRANIKPSDTVLVQGAGPIGIGVAQFAKLSGAKVLVSDVKQSKIDKCVESYHLDGGVNAAGNVPQQLDTLTNGEFPSVIFDCTGNRKAMESAITNLAHGGTIVYVSVIKGQISFDDPEFHKRETTLLGSRNATKDDFEHVVACLKDGSVKSEDFITHVIKFSDMEGFFQSLSSPDLEVIKAVVEMD